MSGRCALPWICSLAAACTPAARAPGQPPAQAQAAATDDWPEYTLVLAGIRAKFPKPPSEFGEAVPKGEVTVVVDGLRLEQDGASYECVHVRVPGHDRATDEVQLAHYAKALAGERAKSSPIELAGFRGVEVEGQGEHGHLFGRIYSVGDGAMYGSVSGPEKKLDRARAARFLSGCQFDLPWRVVPLREGGFTVAVPAFGIEADTAALKDWPAGTVGRIFVLGGKHELTYLTAATPVDPDARGGSDPDTLLQSVSEAVTEGARVSWSAPVEVDGVRGRDLIWSKDGIHYRWRMLVTPDRLFQLGISTRSPELLRAPDAERFFASLRRIDDD